MLQLPRGINVYPGTILGLFCHALGWHMAWIWLLLDLMRTMAVEAHTGDHGPRSSFDNRA